MKEYLKKSLWIVVMLLGVLALPGLSYGYAVDGNLVDWGVAPAYDWAPNSGIAYTVENDDYPSQLYVNGGQGYDAEAMYAAFDSMYLYYAIVTGYGPSSSNSGDIALDFSGGRPYEYGINTVWDASFTVAGGLYGVNTWNNVSEYKTGTSTPWTMNSVSGLLGTGSLIYASGYGRYVIEGRIPTAAFGEAWGKDFTMSWTMSCGNDVIRLGMKGQGLPPSAVPEPASMVLFGLGLGGLGMMRRKFA
jgi:hypothetical protein